MSDNVKEVDRAAAGGLATAVGADAHEGVGTSHVVSSRETNSVNEVDNEGRTRLHLAAEAHRTEDCLNLLQDESFKMVNTISPAVCARGGTALHYAAREGLLKVCLALLQHKDFKAVNAVDGEQRTALHLAADKGRSEVCLALLEDQSFVTSLDNPSNGIKVAEVDEFGYTVLHYAAEEGLLEVCLALLKDERFTEMDINAMSKGWPRGQTAGERPAACGCETCRAAWPRGQTAGERAGNCTASERTHAAEPSL